MTRMRIKMVHRRDVFSGTMFFVLFVALLIGSGLLVLYRCSDRGVDSQTARILEIQEQAVAHGYAVWKKNPYDEGKTFWWVTPASEPVEPSPLLTTLTNE